MSRFKISIILLSLLFILPLKAATEQKQSSPEAKSLIEALSLREGGQAMDTHPRWQTPRQILVVMPKPIAAYGDIIAQSLKPVTEGIDVNIYIPDSAPAPDFVKEAEVVIGFCYKTLLDQLPQLIWFQNLGSGSEGCSSLAGVEAGDFTLTNIRKIAAAPIAEHAISLVLLFNKNLHRYQHNQAQSIWKPHVEPSTSTGELSEKTLLVLGLGGIGTQVAKRAHALGIRVIATRNSSRNGPDYVAKVGLADELYDLAEEADFVVNSLPLTPATQGLINQRFFNAMKPGAVYISVGRGRSTNQDDLVSALNSGQLGGAGLDVTDPEPLPSDHPLWTMDNVVITPHIAGMSSSARNRTLILFQENVRRYLNGDKLLNVVNIKKGY